MTCPNVFLQSIETRIAPCAFEGVRVLMRVLEAMFGEKVGLYQTSVLIGGLGSDRLAR